MRLMVSTQISLTRSRNHTTPHVMCGKSREAKKAGGRKEGTCEMGESWGANVKYRYDKKMLPKENRKSQQKPQKIGRGEHAEIVANVRLMGEWCMIKLKVRLN